MKPALQHRLAQLLKTLLLLAVVVSSARAQAAAVLHVVLPASSISVKAAEYGQGGDREVLRMQHRTRGGTQDIAGELFWEGDIDAYGVIQKEQGPSAINPHRFPGQYADEELGLHYNRHRYYDPDSGQYISQDPIGLAGGLRLHEYVGDPTCFVDPLGLATCKFTGTAKKAKWVKSRQGVDGPGLRDHFAKHGSEVGARTAREFDESARRTIQSGRKFTYRDRSSGSRRVGYWDAETGLFTATDQTRKDPAILTHFPETWENLRRLPGFSTG